MIKKTLCILATSLLLSISTTFLTAKEPTTDPAVAPSEESQQLADKQIDKKINDLKEALAGMRSAVDKKDRASFRLYRTEARNAINELDNLANEQVTSESGAAKKAAREERNREGQNQSQEQGAPTPNAKPASSPAPENTPASQANPTPNNSNERPQPSPENNPSPANQ
jgi:hypothetical protein